MKKFLLLFLIAFGVISAQDIKLPMVALTGVEFKIDVTNRSLIQKRLDLTFKSGTVSKTVCPRVDEEYNLKTEIDRWGKYTVYLNHKEAGTLWVLPGWFSLLPPLLAITLALLIRQVIISLAAGIYLGALFLYGFNPVIAFLRFADKLVLESLTDPGHLYIILFTLLIGGVVGVISSNGGTGGLAAQITRFAKKPRSGMISSWLMGLAVFFDDYANTLIIGNMMRPITDKLRVSREKLAYIVDSTSAPIASISIISTWIGYELGLIGDGLAAVGIDQNAYDVFLNTIPYRFYPIGALFLVFLTSWFQRDFGPMYKKEMKARRGEETTGHIETAAEEKEKFEKGKWYNAAIPVLIILFGTLAGLVYTGLLSIEEKGITEYGLREIISYSDSYASLLWSSFAAGIVAVLMTVGQKIMNLEDSMKEWSKGLQSMLFACTILVFAWAISDVTAKLQTADYLISILRGLVNPAFLPLYVFIICGMISFATGTSWGTMAIVMPIVIPLTWKLAGTAGIPEAEIMPLIYGVVSSVLAGAVFGDHCSPIADTTILSSLASKCDHMAHVNTQLPYALTVGGICIVLGELLTAFGLSPWIAILLIFAAIAGVVFTFGKSTVVDEI